MCHHASRNQALDFGRWFVYWSFLNANAPLSTFSACYAAPFSKPGTQGNTSFSTDFMRQNSQPLVHKPNKMALFRLLLLLLISLPPPQLLFALKHFPPSHSLCVHLCFYTNFVFLPFINAELLSLSFFFSPPVGLKTARKNQTQPVDFGMSFLMSAFQKISTSSLSLSQVRSACSHIPIDAPSVCVEQRHTLHFLKFQGNAGHIRVVPCGLRVFVRARDNLCLMWTEPLTQGAQR